MKFSKITTACRNSTAFGSTLTRDALRLRLLKLIDDVNWCPWFCAAPYAFYVQNLKSTWDVIYCNNMYILYIYCTININQLHWLSIDITITTRKPSCLLCSEFLTSPRSLAPLMVWLPGPPKAFKHKGPKHVQTLVMTFPVSISEGMLTFPIIPFPPSLSPPFFPMDCSEISAWRCHLPRKLCV